MKPLFLTASEANLAAPECIGGKASGLAWLGRHGFPVPPWVVLPTDTTAELLRAHGRQERVQRALRTLPEDPDEARAVLASLRERIVALDPPPSFMAELRRVLANLPGDEEAPVAVRSSAVGEDGSAVSFAGQLDSFLCARDAEAVARAVLRCWASALSDRAVAYRRQHGLPPDELRVAVVIQTVVEGDASGVLFTAHPVTGSRRHALVAAAHGLGEGVVSGHVDADEWTVPIDDEGPVEAHVRTQAEAARFDSGAGAVRYCALSEEVGRTPTLAEADVRVLVALGARAARAAGRPLDIEWTRKGGEWWLLQARPITALPSPEAGARDVWDNANIQESYCGVTTPLTFSFARRAYATVYRQTMRTVRLPERTVAAHAHLLDTLLGLHRGRVYYHIDHWYRGLLLLPAFRRNKADMERMMGLQHPVDFIEDETRSLGERLRRLPGLALTLGRLLHRFARIDGLVADFHRAFRVAYEAVDRAGLHTRSAAELVDLTRTMRAQMLERWTVPIVNDFFVMMMGGRVRRALERAGVEQPDLALSGLLAGLDELESLAPTRRLLALCDTVRQDAELTSLIDELPDERLPAAVQAVDPAFWAACEDYIEAYGDRCPGELKLETLTVREGPARLFAMLRGLLARPDLGPMELQRGGRDLRARTEREVEAQIRRSSGPLGRLRVRRFRRDLDRFRRGVRHRESTRMERARMFGLFRSVYLELGRQLHLGGELDGPRDILFLTVDEIDALRDGTAVQTDLRPLVRARRAEFARYEREDLPHHFATWGLASLGNVHRAPASPVSEGEASLQGVGCYPGLVEGGVAVVEDPERPPEVAGRILCAVRTDPGWTPLFPQASGLLVERGSALSHSAVVARELGIPCIVGLPGLTQRLRTGDRVRMDGGAGRVEVFERSTGAGVAGVVGEGALER